MKFGRNKWETFQKYSHEHQSNISGKITIENGVLDTSLFMSLTYELCHVVKRFRVLQHRHSRVNVNVSSIGLVAVF